MAEFIGMRMSLISNSDIRYVGTLTDVNPEASTVALENVSMLGTEGRRPNNEVPALDSIYEYILFRGSDVKDVKIEEQNSQPQVPDDPAILGSGTRPKPQMMPRSQHPPAPVQNQGLPILASSQPAQNIQPTIPLYGQHPQYAQLYPHPSGWNRSSLPGPSGYPSMLHGGPPDWYPGHQERFIPGPQLMSQTLPIGPSTAATQQQSAPNTKPIPIGPGGNKIQILSKDVSLNVDDAKTLPESGEITTFPARNPPMFPVESNLSSNKIKAAAVSHSVKKQELNSEILKNVPVPTGPKNLHRTKPVSPMRDLAGVGSSNQSVEPMGNVREATQAAPTAVAIPTSKPSPKSPNRIPSINKGSTNQIKNSRRASASNTSTEKLNRATHRAHKSRDGARGSNPKTEVPAEDFDFELANAKFSKQDLIREATSETPTVEDPEYKSPIEQKGHVTYNKATSFFDNISNEAKDRQEAGNTRPCGRAWRGEEQKRNLETFGQESIDNGYRGGYRGRGRGRGGYRGRGHIRNQSSNRRSGNQSRRESQVVS